MKVVMISTDRSILKEGSSAHKRMVDYSNLFDSLHIIVYTKEKCAPICSEKLHVYPTNSKNRLWYISDAIEIGKSFTDVSVVTAQDPHDTGLTAYLLSQHHMCPLQLQMHTDILSPYFAKVSFLSWIRQRIAKWLLPHADGIRVVSKRIKDSLDSLHLKAKPIILPIHSNISVPSFTPRPDAYASFAKVALTVSRLEKEKNVKATITAVAPSIKQDSTIGLFIAGTGRDEASLKKYAEQLGIEKNVVFLGFVQDLIPYYMHADVYIQSSWYEGYGLALLEAAQCGTPIVTTDVGLIGDIISEKEASVCPVDDTDCLSKFVKLVLMSKEKPSRSVTYHPKSYEEYLKEMQKSLEQCL